MHHSIDLSLQLLVHPRMADRVRMHIMWLTAGLSWVCVDILHECNTPADQSLFLIRTTISGVCHICFSCELCWLGIQCL